MTVAVVLGGADTVVDDYRAYVRDFGFADGVVACNDAIGEFAGAQFGVTLHPENLQRWVNRREQQGYPVIPLYTHKVTRRFAMPKVQLIEYNFPGQSESMTSGVMAAKVALIDLGFDKVVLCGVPMTDTPHLVKRPNAPTWDIADHYFKRWRTMIKPEYRSRMRSMSGRTRELLGYPDEEFCRG